MPYLKKLYPITLAVAVLISLSGCNLNFTFVDGYSFTYKGEKAERTDDGVFEEGITSIRVVNTFGDVKVVESTDAPKWTWDGICWSETTEEAESLLEDLVLAVSTENNVQTFEIILPDSCPELKGVKSNLTLSIPADVNVDIENGHGNVDLKEISADVKAVNRHGDLTASRLGNAVINNRHGNTSIKNVSGTLNVSSAHGDFVGEALSESADIENSHGNISVTNAVDISAEGSHSKIRLENIDGDVDVENQHGNIHIVGATGSVTAGTTHAKTEIESSGNTVKVDSRHGNVMLRLTSKNLMGVSAKTTHANITLIAPELKIANIEAKTTHGKVNSEIESSDGSTTVIRLNNQHGNINIKN